MRFLKVLLEDHPNNLRHANWGPVVGFTLLFGVNAIGALICFTGLIREGGFDRGHVPPEIFTGVWAFICVPVALACIAEGVMKAIPTIRGWIRRTPCMI